MTVEKPSHQLPKDEQPEEFGIVLPCSPRDFRDFVSGLLGKPQTITQVFDGPFDINKHDIENFYFLVVQRISQQNEGHLIQFTARIVYDDNSTVLLNSIDDFNSYNEIRDIASTGIHLSWTFLVKFQDRSVPEKQQIDVSIISEGSPRFLNDDSPAIFFHKVSQGIIAFRIQHTARTWGADIEALLSGHIETLIREVHPLKKFLSENDGWVGLFTGSALFLSAILSAFYITNNFLKECMSKASGLLTIVASDPEMVSKKINYLIEIMAAGMWSRYFFSIGSFVTAALFISILIGVWAGSSADNNEPSFVVLSRKAEKRKVALLKKNKSAWNQLILSLTVGVVTGVVGNFLFAYYFQGWRP